MFFCFVLFCCCFGFVCFWGGVVCLFLFCFWFVCWFFVGFFFWGGGGKSLSTPLKTKRFGCKQELEKTATSTSRPGLTVLPANAKEKEAVA